MSTRISKVVSRILLAAMLFSVSASMIAVPANAYDSLNGPTPRSRIFISRTYSGSFDEAWRKTVSDFSMDGSTTYYMDITYGYNTVLINEDYCWADCEDYAHWASLRNGNGEHEGPIAFPGFTSKIEVTHNGSSISYYCNLS